jgi:hypothetical protein
MVKNKPPTSLCFDKELPIQYFGLDDLYSAGMLPCLHEILYVIRRYNRVIDLYSQGLLLCPNMAAIIDQQNWIQHRLLSISLLHGTGGKTEFFQVHRAYEPCRYAALIYSLLIVFRLPFKVAPFPQLAGMLKGVLLKYDLHDIEQPAVTLLLWIVVVGGIPVTTERTWFVETLRQLTLQVNVFTRLQLKLLLKSVLWLDSVCDPIGSELWNWARKRWPI